jgi:hypothetical protein
MSEEQGHPAPAAPARDDEGWMNRWRRRRSERREIRADRRARRQARMIGGSPDDAARQAESHAMTTGSTFGKGDNKPKR